MHCVVTRGLPRLFDASGSIMQTTHDKVKRKALTLISMWTGEFKDDPTLGIMEECYNSLKSKSAQRLLFA